MLTLPLLGFQSSEGEIESEHINTDDIVGWHSVPRKNVVEEGRKGRGKEPVFLTRAGSEKASLNRGHC